MSEIFQNTLVENLSEQPGDEVPYYKVQLQLEYNKRCTRNPRYSIRAFARAAKVDPSLLAKVLSNKASMSYTVASRLLTQLTLSPTEQTAFLKSLANEKLTHSFSKLKLKH